MRGTFWMRQEIDAGGGCYTWRQNEFKRRRTAFAKSIPLKDPAALAAKLNKGKGRGIITAAGNTEHLANAFSNLKALRDALKCNLPIELWYRPHEAGDALAVEAIFHVSSRPYHFLPSHVRLGKPQRSLTRWAMHAY
jgi:hypothetical protein